MEEVKNDSKNSNEGSLENNGINISTGEILILLPLCLLADIAEFIPVISELVSIPVGAIITIWMFYKKLKWKANFIASIIDLIPILNWLPIKTVTFLIIIRMAKNPKLAEKMESVAKVAAKVVTKV